MHEWRVVGVILLCGCAGIFLGLLIALAIVSPQDLQPNQNQEPSKQTVVIAGDISCEPGAATTTFTCRSADTAALIESLQPDAVLTAGDNQYPAGGSASFQEAYDKTWGVFKDKTYPTPGNHEHITSGAAGYYDYFGDRAGERGKGYYRFAVGDWQLFALNSEIDVSAQSEQLAWLKEEIAKYPSVCNLAYWHKPLFSTGGHADDPTYKALWQILYDNNFDIVVNGHSHGYERFVAQNPDGQPDAARGITQFVSGMGGANTQSLRSPVPTLATRQNHSFGVLKLDLYNDHASFAFMPISAAQAFEDAGTVACH